jgi:hypothetical protein
VVSLGSRIDDLAETPLGYRGYQVARSKVGRRSRCHDPG